MGKVLFVLALSVLTAKSKVLNNQVSEVAHKRLVRSPCEDCDDSPRSSSEPLNPRYFHSYPRHFDYPPPPVYYQFSPPPDWPPPPEPPPPPGPPPPGPSPPGSPSPPISSPYYGHHWHKVINDNDEQDDNDSDYTDSAEAYSGIIGQNSGHAFSSATVGTGGNGNGRFESHFPFGSQSPNNQGGQYSGSFKGQNTVTGSGAHLSHSFAQSNVNAQSSLRDQSGQRYGEVSSINSGIKSSDNNGFSIYSSSTSSSSRSHSNDTSNRQKSEKSSQSSFGVKSQSYINNKSQVSANSHYQINESNRQSMLSGIPEGKNISVQSIDINKQMARSDIRSNVSNNHFHSKINTENTSDSGTFSNVYNIQPSGKDRSTILSQNNLNQLKAGVNRKSINVGSLKRTELNSQSNNDQRNSFTSNYNTQSYSLNSQTTPPLNTQSSNNFAGLRYQNSKDFLNKYNKNFSDKTKSSDDFNNLASSYDDQSEERGFGRDTYFGANSYNLLKNPEYFKPLYSHNFDDTRKVTTSSKFVHFNGPEGLPVDDSSSNLQHYNLNIQSNRDNSFSTEHSISGELIQAADNLDFNPKLIDEKQQQSTNEFLNSKTNFDGQNNMTNFGEQSSDLFGKNSKLSNNQLQLNQISDRPKPLGIQKFKHFSNSSLGASETQHSGTDSQAMLNFNHHQFDNFSGFTNQGLQSQINTFRQMSASNSSKHTSKNIGGISLSHYNSQYNGLEINKPYNSLGDQSTSDYISTSPQKDYIIRANHLQNLGDTYIRISKTRPHNHDDEIASSLNVQSDKNSGSSNIDREDIKQSFEDKSHVAGRLKNSKRRQELNADSIDNEHEIYNFGSDLDNSAPANISGITASSLRKSLANLDHFRSKEKEDQRYDLSLEKPITNLNGFGSKFSAESNEQSNNNLNASTQSIQSHTNFNGVSLANTAAPYIQSSDYIDPYIDKESFDSNAQSDLGNKPSNSGTIPTPFFVQSSSTETQFSPFDRGHSKDSNIHSFTMDDQICVCGPQSSTLLSSLSKSGPIHDFNNPNEMNVQSSLGTQFGKDNEHLSNDQISDKETQVPLQNNDHNILHDGVKFRVHRLNNDISNEQSSSTEEMNTWVNKENDNKFDPTHKHDLLSQSSHIELQSTPKSNENENNGNGDQRKQELDFRQFDYRRDGTNNPFTEQQRTSNFENLKPNFIGDASITTESASNSRDNEYGIRFNEGLRSFKQYGPGRYNPQSSLRYSYNLRAQGSKFPEQSGCINCNGGSSYALSNARSKNQDAFAISVGT